MKNNYEVKIVFNGVRLLCDCNYTPPQPARWGNPVKGDMGEPEQPSELEIQTVQLLDERGVCTVGDVTTLIEACNTSAERIAKEVNAKHKQRARGNISTKHKSHSTNVDIHAENDIWEELSMLCEKELQAVWEKEEEQLNNQLKAEHDEEAKAKQ